MSSTQQVHQPPKSAASIIDAQTIADALGGKRCGREWRACCPAHGGDNPTALAIRDGDNGRILVHCFRGCTQTEVIAELSSRGLWPKPTQEQRRYAATREHRENLEHAKTILMLAEDGREEEWSEKDKADIAAARRQVRVNQDEGNVIAIPTDQEIVQVTHAHAPCGDNCNYGDVAWRFDYHCTTTSPIAVALNFQSLENDFKSVAFFNCFLEGRKGKSYPAGRGGQFNTAKNSKFRKNYVEWVGAEPYRWSLAHRYMKKDLGGLVFTGETVNAIDSKGKPYLKLLNPRLK